MTHSITAYWLTVKINRVSETLMAVFTLQGSRTWSHSSPHLAFRAFRLSWLLTVYVTGNFLFLFPCCRDVVFTCTNMCWVPLAHPSLGDHRSPQSTDQRGAEVRLATCYHCHANQQVTIQEEFFFFANF